MLISAVQQSDSVIYIYIYILFVYSFPYGYHRILFLLATSFGLWNHSLEEKL